MSISNLSDLKQKIEFFSHRTDLSDVIDSIIQLTENELDTKLFLRNNELRSTATTSTSSRFLALPDGFLRMRRFSIIDDTETYALIYKAPQTMRIADTSDTDRPSYYTITSQLEFNIVPDQAYTVEMAYYRTITPLTTSNTTNDVLTDHPDCYLWGCLKNLAIWERDIESVAMYERNYLVAISAANQQERQGRTGAAPKMFLTGSRP